MRNVERWLLLVVIVACALLGGLWRLRVDRTVLHEREARPASTAAERRARMLPPDVAASLSGTVRAGGAPIAGAVVCAACVNCEPTGAPPSPCTKSDAHGRYAFAQLAPEGYFVSATAAGWVPGRAKAGRPIILETAQAQRGVDIDLSPGGARVTGVVLDATGTPIAGASVRAIRGQHPPISLDLVSNAQGAFAVSWVPGYIELIAEADGYAPARGGFFAPRDGVELRLTPAGSLRGTVVAAGTGQPLSGIEVRALPVRNPSSPIFRSTLSGADGAFVLQGMEPGSFSLRAKGDGWDGAPASSIELGLAESVADLRVEVGPAANVLGRVVTKDGKPCRAGRISLGAPDPLAPSPAAEHPNHVAFGDKVEEIVGPEQIAHIAADGKVALLGVPAGFYFVRVQCSEHTLHSGPATLQIGAETIADLTWTVVPAGTLRVRVVDGAGQPIPHASFFLRRPDFGGTRARPRTVHHADDRGSTEIVDLRPGSYEVAPIGGATRGAPVAVELHEAQQGPRAAEVTLRLNGSGMIVVEARTAHGTPVDDLQVSARAVTPMPAADVQSGPREHAHQLGHGRFRIGPLASGAYVVTAEDGVNPPIQYGAARGTEIAVSDGATAHVRLQVPSGGVIRGRVLDAGGGPAANVWVTPKHEADAPAGGLIPMRLSEAKRVLTDREGEFAIAGLAPDARYVLRASRPYGAAAIARGVVPGTPVAITLPAAAAISGIAVDANGAPLPYFMVRASEAETGSEHEATVADAQGRFALRGMAPGSIELQVIAGPHAVATRTVELTPGQKVEGLRVVVQSSALTATTESAGPALGDEGAGAQR
jgi:hypothetical protein